MTIAAQPKSKANTFEEPQASIRSIESTASRIKENCLEATRKPILEIEDDLQARDVPELNRELVVTVRTCT
jgi:hypothetical protein